MQRLKGKQRRRSALRALFVKFNTSHNLSVEFVNAVVFCIAVCISQSGEELGST